MAAISAQASVRIGRRERSRRFGTICWRWTLVLLGATGASWLVYGGIRGGAWLPVQVPTTGVAIAAAGAFAGDLMALCVSCDHYVRGERHVSLQSLTPGFWKAWGTLTAIFIALLSYVLPSQVVAKQEEPVAAPVVQVAPAPAPPVAADAMQPWFVVYSTQPPPPAALPRLSTIPVFFRNNAAPETARLRRQDVVPGVSFVPEELDVSIEGLRRILAALTACGAAPGAAPAQLEIAGYASSKEFVDPVGGAQADSDLRNARIANRRARAAYCFVGGQTPVELVNAADWKDHEDGAECVVPKSARFDAATPPLQVTVRRWTEDAAGYQQMVAARKFVDRPPGVAQAAYNDPEELNRRVDIHVVSAGACSAPASSLGAAGASAMADETAPVTATVTGSGVAPEGSADAQQDGQEMTSAPAASAAPSAPSPAASPTPTVAAASRGG